MGDQGKIGGSELVILVADKAQKSISYVCVINRTSFAECERLGGGGGGGGWMGPSVIQRHICWHQPQATRGVATYPLRKYSPLLQIGPTG